MSKASNMIKESKSLIRAKVQEQKELNRKQQTVPTQTQTYIQPPPPQQILNPPLQNQIMQNNIKTVQPEANPEDQNQDGVVNSLDLILLALDMVEYMFNIVIDGTITPEEYKQLFDMITQGEQIYNDVSSREFPTDPNNEEVRKAFEMVKAEISKLNVENPDTQGVPGGTTGQEGNVDMTRGMMDTTGLITPDMQPVGAGKGTKPSEAKALYAQGGSFGLDADLKEGLRKLAAGMSAVARHIGGTTKFTVTKPEKEEPKNDPADYQKAPNAPADTKPKTAAMSLPDPKQAITRDNRFQKPKAAAGVNLKQPVAVKAPQ